ncbi:MAG: sigma-54-dependent Fis family transcriptional regulator [Planctomycetes bacterium]|nr:sigma-54-dependent Fis family transcriptional regulator [Planctomycetota bacterium]
MARTAFILIVTEQEGTGEKLRDTIRGRHGHVCNVVTQLDEALASIRGKAPDVVVAGARMNGAAVIEPLVRELDKAAPDATLLTVGGGNGSVRAQHITIAPLPGDVSIDELAGPIGDAADKAVARREDRLLHQSLESASAAPFEGIIGDSPKIRRIVERIKKAARNKLTVLVLGETGTGKQLIAEAIHKHSDRSHKPHKHLNCAGLNENLLDSELFGHVKGSFTSALADRKGYFEAAHGGTLFLDEIGDMPLSMQAKLLTVLDSREITPVGSTDVRRVDVRVIAATHRDLAERIEEGKFREDLYYRLHQWVIEVPPLRERREDIPVLVHHFIERANGVQGASVTGASSETLGYLTKYFWPGNVRELKSTVDTLVAETENGQIEAERLPESIRGSRAIVPSSLGSFAGLTIAEVEKMLIQHTLTNTAGNREQAARMLGIGTRTLYRKLKEYGLT